MEMHALEKIDKILDYQKKLDNWNKYAEYMRALIKDEERQKKNYRSVLYLIRNFLGLPLKDQFELSVLNNEVGLLKVNLDYANEEIFKLEQAIMEL